MALIVFVLASAVAAISPALAGASTTIGQTSGTPVSCQTTGTNVWWTSGSGQPLYAVPAGGGVITSWTTSPGLGGTATRLEVFRPSPSDTVVGESDIQSPIPAHNTTAFPVRITAQAGDLIGLENIGSATIWCAISVPGDAMSLAADNGSGMALGSVLPLSSDLRADVSAVVEPDADGDGYGDETQARADLAIATSASARGTVGDELTDALTVTNHGPEAAPAVVVTDPLPAGTAFVSASSTAASCDATVTCSLGTLASGASVTVTIVVKATQAGTMRNIATVDSQALDVAAEGYVGRGDTNPANNSATATTTVAPLPLPPPVAAKVSHAGESNRTFRESARPRLVTSARRRPPVGTRFRYTLDKAAAVRLSFTQLLRGRRTNGRCVAQNRRNTRKPRCTRTAIRGSLASAGHAGVNTVRFYGWLSHSRKLRPGRYTLAITATTPGLGSTSQKLAFRIAR